MEKITGRVTGKFCVNVHVIDNVYICVFGFERDRLREAYLGQSIKRCTTERGRWQLGQRGGSECDIRCPCVSRV